MNISTSTSVNPGPTYASFREVAASAGLDPAYDRPVVCVQGLGFVGSAMAIAVADARQADGTPAFNVIGVELPTQEGRAKVAALNAGRLPVTTTDERLRSALSDAHERGNLVATVDGGVYPLASVAVVDVPLDVTDGEDGPTVAFDGFRSAIRTLGRLLPPGALVVVETTVPPGTCEKIVEPELAAALTERGLPPDALLLAHSYERVMPGDLYLDSIVNFWRSYAGLTEEAADACEAFLSNVVNVAEYPLTRLSSPTACETAKVLENSYRATTIALMEEWGRFAEAAGIDLFEVISAIRRRPTHSNIRQPGFGVGGYCLTKDPLLGAVAARELLGLDAIEFPFSTLAVETNREMPLVTLRMLAGMLDGVGGKAILLLGVSYRQDVADTRNSPAEVFVRAAREKGATVTCHDPLVTHWPELDLTIDGPIPSPDSFDAIVFAVPHSAYTTLELGAWLNGSRPVVLDANGVLTEGQQRFLRQVGCHVGSIGRGTSM